MKEPGNDETVLLHFTAGPPYEDIAFRIVNREWEYSHKRYTILPLLKRCVVDNGNSGFRSSFDRGCLSLWFNFRRSVSLSPFCPGYFLSVPLVLPQVEYPGSTQRLIFCLSLHVTLSDASERHWFFPGCELSQATAQMTTSALALFLLRRRGVRRTLTCHEWEAPR